MDVDELIGRLRTWQKYGGWVEHEHITYGVGTGKEYRTKERTPTIVYQPEPLMRQAADALQSLAAERDALRNLVGRAQIVGQELPQAWHDEVRKHYKETSA